MKEAYFVSTKDRVVRGLRTYFTSRRADSNALYYRDALLASKDGTIEESLALAEKIDLASLLDHHACLLKNDEIYLECLISGNVSSKTAKKIFSNIDGAISETKGAGQESRDVMSHVPGTQKMSYPVPWHCCYYNVPTFTTNLILFSFFTSNDSW